MDSKSIKIINIARGLGIIMVVFAHVPGQPLNTFSPYIFHMPLFFFIGGLCFNAEKSYKQISLSVIKKHIPYIVYTYVITGLICLFLWEKYAFSAGQPFADSLTGTISLAYKNNMHNNQIFLVAWFLIAYSIVSLIYPFLIKFLKEKKLIIFSTSAILMVAMYKIAGQGPVSPQYINISLQVAVGGFFYCSGWIMRNKINTFRNVWAFFLVSIVMIFLTQTGQVVNFSMAWGVYPTGLLLQIVGCIAGIYATMFFSNLSQDSSILSKLISDIGIESRVIMSYHLTFFSLLSIYFSVTLGVTVSMQSPYITPYTWYAYTIIGIMAPYLSIKTFRALRDKIKEIKISKRLA